MREFILFLIDLKLKTVKNSKSSNAISINQNSIFGLMDFYWFD